MVLATTGFLCAPTRLIAVQSGELERRTTGEEPIFEVDLTNEEKFGRTNPDRLDVRFTPKGDFLIVGRRAIRTSDWEMLESTIPIGDFLTTAWPNRVVCFDSDARSVVVRELSSPDGESKVIPSPVHIWNPARVCAAREEPNLFVLESASGYLQVRVINLDDGTNEVLPILPKGFNKKLVFNFSLMDHDRYVIILCRSAVYLFDREQQEWLTSPDLETAMLEINEIDHRTEHHIARIHWVHGSNSDSRFFASTRGSTDLECRVDRDAMKISFGFIGEFDLETIEVSAKPDERRERPGFRYRPTVNDSRHYQIASINDDQWFIVQCHHYMLRVQNTCSVAIHDRESGRQLASFDSRRGTFLRIPFAFSNQLGAVAIVDPDGVLRVWDVPAIERIAHRLKEEEEAREENRIRRQEEFHKERRREQAGRQIVDFLLDGTLMAYGLGTQWTYSRVALIKQLVREGLSVIRRFAMS